ncbi:hypothetical protein [Erythrobacter rubeus]|uniref:hypothetical protein n=1 Tax=Erythrobacter rubeus TaxID=2760803 RepID=UPI001F2B128A|nr:hypothetical protein [Erythrobacter rubeus]
MASIQITQGLNVSLSGCEETCPRCGAWADIVAGTFDVTGGPHPTFTQTAGEPVDPELFTRLGIILVNAKLDNLKPAEVVEKVGPLSPGLARSLRGVMDDPKAFASVLQAAIATFGVIAAAAIGAAVAISTADNTKPDPAEIEVQRDDGQLRRDRDRLQEMRQRNLPVPAWATELL